MGAAVKGLSLGGWDYTLRISEANSRRSSMAVLRGLRGNAKQVAGEVLKLTAFAPGSIEEASLMGSGHQPYLAGVLLWMGHDPIHLTLKASPWWGDLMTRCDASLRRTIGERMEQATLTPSHASRGRPIEQPQWGPLSRRSSMQG